MQGTSSALADGRDRVGRLGREAHEHDVDLVVDDQLACATSAARLGFDWLSLTITSKFAAASELAKRSG
jgi:hypothetical protein